MDHCFGESRNGKVVRGGGWCREVLLDRDSSQKTCLDAEAGNCAGPGVGSGRGLTGGSRETGVTVQAVFVLAIWDGIGEEIPRLC